MPPFPFSRRLIGIMAVVAMLLIVLLGCSPGTQTSEPPANPLTGIRLYHDPESKAANAVDELKRSGRADEAAKIAVLADTPAAIWLSGGPGDEATAARVTSDAAAHGSVPILVLYNIPKRDIEAGLSEGGAADSAAYSEWVRRIIDATSNRKAIFIVEPDGVTAVADHHLTGQDATERLALLHKTVAALAVNPSRYVYVDAGNPGWKAPEAMVDPLEQAGVGLARGIAVNVSNFYSDDASQKYGEAISKALGGTGVVIDTSRNGNGPYTQPDDRPWCNPPGRALGRAPTIGGDHDTVQAWLWIKDPGESDGACRAGAPEAGKFWLDYALGLTNK